MVADVPATDAPVPSETVEATDVTTDETVLPDAPDHDLTEQDVPVPTDPGPADVAADMATETTDVSADTGVPPPYEFKVDDLAYACLFGRHWGATPPSNSHVGGCVHDLLQSAGGATSGWLVSGWLSRSPFFYAACASLPLTVEEYRGCVQSQVHTTWCVDHPGTACDGSTSIQCFDDPGDPTNPEKDREALPCDQLGMSCLDGVGCTDGTVCPGTATASCSGNIVMQCEPGWPKARATLVCATEHPCDTFTSPGGGPGGGRTFAFCTWPSCPAQGSSCDGDKLVNCLAQAFNPGGEEKIMGVPLDCALEGAHCKTVGDGAKCDWTGAECDPSTYPEETCDGDFLKTCIAGKWWKLDCAKAGRKPCVTDGRSGAARCGDPLNT